MFRGGLLLETCRDLHATQSHTARHSDTHHMLPQHRNNYNDVLLLINFTKV
jgi:hypothetical protein